MTSEGTGTRVLPALGLDNYVLWSFYIISFLVLKDQ
jgi:hypothetical protein